MEDCESVCGSSHNFKHCLNVSVRQCLRTDQHRLSVSERCGDIKGYQLGKGDILFCAASKKVHVTWVKKRFLEIILTLRQRQ